MASDKCIIYTRYSPRRQDHCESLEAQEDHCRRYFDFIGIEVGDIIRDPDTSARLVPLENRIGGARLLELTTGRKPVYTIVGAYRLDRLFRSVIDGNNILAKWRKRGVACHFTAEGGQSLNTATATGRFIVNMLLARAEYEPDLCAERTSHGMLHKQANGKPMSKEPPYGYHVVDGLLADHSVERANIQLMIEWHSEGLSARAIARRLQAEGVKPRRKYWNHNTVIGVLKREMVAV